MKIRRKIVVVGFIHANEINKLLLARTQFWRASPLGQFQHGDSETKLKSTFITKKRTSLNNSTVQRHT